VKEILGDLDRWLAAGRRVVLARVVGVDGSGPRSPGAAMAVDETGEVAGSVSGGCVEGAVVGEAVALLEGGGAPRVLTFSGDDGAMAVGLTCGGTILVLLEELSWVEAYRALRADLVADRAVALATVVHGPRIGRNLLVRPGHDPIGSLGSEDLDRVVARDALAALEVGRPLQRRYGRDGEALQEDVAVFIDAHGRAPRMVICGAVDFTAALARVARIIGYAVTVCDARPVFATRRRFPSADEVVVDWPHRYLDRVGPTLGPDDAVILLTHDDRFDVPAVQAALATGVGYLGAMGSRRTTDDRRKRLLDEGVAERDLDRLHAPVGLDIGARSPEETAVSICAEIIATRTGHGARPLGSVAGPIHTDP
jgi:xanthine dehydrogenase accessory factor